MPGAEHIDMNDAGPKSGKRLFKPPEVQAQTIPFIVRLVHVSRMNTAHIDVIHKLTISFEDTLQSSLTVLASSTSLELPTSGPSLMDRPEDATSLMVSSVE